MAKEISYIITYEEIEVTVTVKRVKGLRLRVRNADNRVIMSLPVGMSREHAERFVREKADWIRGALRRNEARPENAAQHCDTESEIRIFDEAVILHFTEGVRQCRREGNEVWIGVPRGADAQKREAALAAYLRGVLEEEIRKELPALAARVGVEPASWHTRRMTSRWGSCSMPSRRLCFNTRLVHYPRVCLTYVMVHELCHIHVMAHNKRFWSLVAGHCPQYKAMSQPLKKK